MAPSTFSSWLDRHIKRSGLSQAKWAVEAGQNPSVVNRWINGGQKPSARSAAAIADYLRVPIAEVYELIGIPSEPTEPRAKQSFDDQLAQLMTERPVAIPIHEQTASAGIGAEVLEYVYWEPARAAGKEIVGVRVFGNSMEPDINDGDVVYVDKSAAATPGHVVLASVDGKVVIKWLVEERGKLYLVGNNGKVLVDDDTVRIEGLALQISRSIPVMPTTRVAPAFVIDGRQRLNTLKLPGK